MEQQSNTSLTAAAIAAYTQKREREAEAARQAAEEEEREKNLREAPILQRLLRENLGWICTPLAGNIEIDGVCFLLCHDNQYQSGGNVNPQYSLRASNYCPECEGGSTSKALNSIEDLGKWLTEEMPRSKCRCGETTPESEVEDDSDPFTDDY